MLPLGGGHGGKAACAVSGIGYGVTAADIIVGAEMGMTGAATRGRDIVPLGGVSGVKVPGR
jgi:hypothetical protein